MFEGKRTTNDPLYGLDSKLKQMEFSKSELDYGQRVWKKGGRGYN